MKEKKIKRIAPARAPRRTSSRASQSITKGPWPMPDVDRPAELSNGVVDADTKDGSSTISNTLDSQTFANYCFGKTSKKTHTMTFLCLQLYSLVKRKQEVPPQQRLLRAADLFCTSCPARRCSGICAPLNFVASNSLLGLRTASSLPSRSLKQHNPMEKLCSALSLCWLKKNPFSNGKRHMLPVTSSPGGSLPFCFLRSSSKVLALRGRASSLLHAVCVLSFNPMSVTGRFALLVAVALHPKLLPW